MPASCPAPVSCSTVQPCALLGRARRSSSRKASAALCSSSTTATETGRMTSVALTEIRPFKISEDIAVPRGKLVEMIREVRRIGQQHGFPTASYGHAGDGNLHVNLLFANADERARGEAAIDEVIET